MKNTLQVLILIAFITTRITAQAKEIAPPDFIKTITFKSNTTQSQLPILKLGEQLLLEFDALNANEEDFYTGPVALLFRQ